VLYNWARSLLRACFDGGLTMLKTQVQMLKGIGPKKAMRLERIGIRTLGDVLEFYPRSYIDKRKIHNFSDVETDLTGTFLCQVVSTSSTRSFGRNKAMLKVQVQDDTQKGELVFFNAAYLQNKYQTGMRLMIFGSAKRQNGKVSFIHPECGVQGEVNAKEFLRIMPVYPLTEGLSQKDIGGLVKQTLPLVLPEIEETLPELILDQHNLMALGSSLTHIHYPGDDGLLLMARKRLIFEELFNLQIGLIYLKKEFNHTIGVQMQSSSKVDDFVKTLPFNLTGAQLKTWKQVEADMISNKTMNRLVQGDVGSGKTMIAILSMYLATLNGYQSAMMAPTEILAEQHYHSLTEFMKPLGIKVGLLKGQSKEKKKVLEELACGEIQVVVGTHALIQKDVEFKCLGLVITDEQHRFGVRQRNTLSDKGKTPDVLIMSATPIPRTLSLILYGDVEVSVIDELPAGRKQIKTHFIQKNKYAGMYKFIEDEVKDGRQAYFVCPLVEDSDVLDIESAESLYERLSKQVFPKLKVGLVHGRIKAQEKDQIMRAFAEGKLDILVSTTVIEVGINVPNASIMVIQNTERFGLSQLHQLRGRVGRGQWQSYCFLTSEKPGKVAKERIQTLVKTNDGFEIADKDLELRGPGELLGIRQHGIPELRLANLSKHGDILEAAQSTAINIMKQYAKGDDPFVDRIVKNVTSKLFDEFSI